jgi:N-acetylglucosaminyldiphosphoundecaprenol N-acetyl-beta-D-mannosaminyltransferase
MADRAILPKDLSGAQSTFKVLGVEVDAVQIPHVIHQMEEWMHARDGSHFIALTSVDTIMQAWHQDSFRQILNAADLTVPDGMPLVWLGRMMGYEMKRRVYGPDLLLDFCRATQAKGYGHFFYGGASGVPERLADALLRRCPHLRVTGTYSPPFRRLTQEEDMQAVEMINQAAPDVLWVGLGCPKQERWMFEHRHLLNVPVTVGVGAAFDFYTGRVAQAPCWMREHGLEWFFRLTQEPRRLWRRYLIQNPQFIFQVCLELARLRRSG